MERLRFSLNVDYINPTNIILAEQKHMKRHNSNTNVRDVNMMLVSDDLLVMLNMTI